MTMTIAKRCARARKAMASKYRDREVRTNIIDLLADLRHYAASRRVDFDDALALATRHFHAERGDEGLVSPHDACPKCREARSDYLVWQDDDSEKVRCASCGHEYQPS